VGRPPTVGKLVNELQAAAPGRVVLQSGSLEPLFIVADLVAPSSDAPQTGHASDIQEWLAAL
jgi:hypothetical protein